MFNFTIIQILRRQAIVIGSVFTLGVALTVLVIIFAPRKYASNAKLLVKLGRENVSVDPSVTTTGDMVSLHRTYETEINTTLNTMASREILERVIDVIGVEAILRGSLKSSDEPDGLLKQIWGIPKGWAEQLDPINDRERAILALKENLKIKAGKQSSVIDVSYSTKTPEMARDVTQAWVDLYRAQHSIINATQGSLQFFVELETELALKLDQARTTLEDAKSKFGIVTISGEQATLESQVRWVKNSITELGTSLKSSEARLLSLREQLHSTNATMIVSRDKADINESQDLMRDRLYQLEIELKRIESTYKAQHPRSIAASEQLQEATKLFQTQKAESEKVTEGISSTYAALEQQIAMEKANSESINARLTATKSELDELLLQSRRLNQHENDIAKLQRSVDILESQYRLQVQNREQARLASELESRNISNVNVFQAASLEHRPVSPNKVLCAMIGLIGSLMSALGVATWREAKRFSAIVSNEDRNDDIAETSLFGRPLDTSEWDKDYEHA